MILLLPPPTWTLLPGGILKFETCHAKPQWNDNNNFFSFNFFHCIKSLSYLPNNIFENFAYLRMPRQESKFPDRLLLELLLEQIKTLKIFIFLDIFFIGLILTKYFGKLPTYFVIYTLVKPSFTFLWGVSYDDIIHTPRG